MISLGSAIEPRRWRRPPAHRRTGSTCACHCPAVIALRKPSACPFRRGLSPMRSFVLLAAMIAATSAARPAADRPQGPGADRPHPQEDPADRRPQRPALGAARESRPERRGARKRHRQARKAADDRHGAAARRAASAANSGRSISAARSPATRRSARRSSRSIPPGGSSRPIRSDLELRLDRRRHGADPSAAAGSARCSGSRAGARSAGRWPALRQFYNLGVALHDADPQPDDRMGRQRHRRAQA